MSPSSSIRRLVAPAGVRFVCLALFVMWLCGTAAAQVYSVAPGGPTPVLPDDILVPPPPGPVPPLFIGTTTLNVDAHSLGRSTESFDIAFPLEFSVDNLSSGLAGTAVAAEAAGGGGGPADHPADIFREIPPGSNFLLWDGDGVANPGAAPPLGLVEPFVLPVGGFGDNTDAWDNQPAPQLGAPIWFSLDVPSAATIPGGPVSAADILAAAVVPGYDASLPPVSVYAPAPSLVLLPTDDIDALVVFEDGAAGFTPGDVVLLSLARGSPSLTTAGSPYFGSGPADVFSVTGGGAVALYRTAAGLGLAAATDNVDALDVVPEPGTITLLGLAALMGLVAGAKSRRRGSNRDAA